VHECEDCHLTFTVEKPFEGQRIFLSYGHDDHTSLAHRLRDDLNTRGHQVWFDEERLAPGHDWEVYIENGLEWLAADKARSAFVLLLTPHSVRRPDGYCLNEVARALSRGLRIVPLMVVESEPPLSICRIQWLDMRECIPIHEKEPLYKPKFERLLKALEEDQLDFEGTQQYLLKTLQPLEFEADILRHLERFIGREWVFQAVDAWLAKPQKQRVFWILGEAGVGKTALCARLICNYRQLAAVHLCKFGHAQKADPRRVVTSVAYQLTTQLPEYEDALAAKDLAALTADDARTMFDNLIVQPLVGISTPDRPIVILIDALDEATQDGYNALAAFVAAEFHKTPNWLRLIVTSRPEASVCGPMQRLDPFLLGTAIEANLADIRAYLERELAFQLKDRAEAENIIEDLVARSEGVFLYVDRVCQDVRDGYLSLDRLDAFPRGLGEAFWQFFERLVYDRHCQPPGPDLERYRRELRPPLRAILAAREPLPVTLLRELFGWHEEELADFTRSLGSLFPVSGSKGRETIQPYHKSLADWMSDHERAGDYFVSETEGHRLLADGCWEEYQRGVETLGAYSLRHLPAHLIEAERWDEVKTLLTDIFFLEAKTKAGLVFDLAGDLSAAGEALPEHRPQRRILKLLDEALRRDIHFIARHAEDYPQGLFQCLWNNGWWYDCPEASAHYVPLPGADVEGSLPWERSGVKLHELLAGWRRQKRQSSCPGFWLRSLRPPPTPLEAGLCGSFYGHTRDVNGVAYSSDGSRIASASDDGTVRVWSAVSGQPLLCLQGSREGMQRVVFSRDGQLVAAGSVDGLVRVWSAGDGHELQTLRRHHGTVYCVAFSPDDACIATGSSDRTVRIWGRATGAELMCLKGHGSMVRSLVFLDSRRLASGSHGGTIRIWDTETRQLVKSFGGGLGTVYGLDYSPSLRRLASASRDGVIRLWDVETGEQTDRLDANHGPIHNVSLSPDGTRIAGGSYDGFVDLWTMGDGKLQKSFSSHDGLVSGVAFSPSGDRIATASSAVRIWNPEGVPLAATLRGHTRWIKTISRSLDGQHIATGSDDATAWIWHSATGVGTVSVRWGNDDSGLSALACSPDASHLAGALWGPSLVRVWNLETAQESITLHGHRLVVRAIAYSPNGQWIATGSNDNTVRLWDAKAGSEEWCFKGHLDAVVTVAFSLDGKLLAAGSVSGTVCIWDVEGKTIVTRLLVPGGAVRSVGFSPDGARLGTCSDDQKTWVWQVLTGRCLEVVDGRGDPGAIAAGPPVHHFRVLGGSTETLLTDSVTGACIARLAVPLWYVSAAPGGNIWAGASGEYLALVALEKSSSAGGLRKPSD